MSELLVTEDDRQEIKGFVDSGAYKKVLEYAIDQSRTTCEAPSDRILYFQGLCAGIRQFAKLLETYSRPPAMRNMVTPEVMERFRSRSDRIA